MNPGEMKAYDAFLHSGKVEDYLRYLNVRERPSAGGLPGGAAMGETGAYHDRRDRAAGAGD